MKSPENKPFLMAKALRVLPPGGGFASPWSLLTASRSLRQSKRQNISTRQLLARALQSAFACERAVITGSGKEAIYLIAEAYKAREGLSNPCCQISAYTCPDVASALIKAGFKLRLFDLDEETLEPVFSDLKKDEPVLLSNLFGFPDSIPAESSFVIDDACQAGLSYLDGKRIGTRGDAGVLSFGRGKAFPGPGGGGALLNSELSVKTLPATSRKHLLSQMGKMFLLWLLQMPSLYRVPASASFLHLGQTEFVHDFSREASRRGASLSAFVQLGNSESRSSVFKKNSELWASTLEGLDLNQVYLKRKAEGLVPIRYPLLLPNLEARDRAWRELQIAGLGATCSYPSVLSDYPQLKEAIVSSSEQGARHVSERILTLPVHRYVRAGDMKKTASILKACLCT